MTVEKPREIIVRAKDDGPTGRKGPGLHARDTQTGAYLWMPTPIMVGGQSLQGREADAHVASRLLPDGKRLTWDRDTSETCVFTVRDA